MSSAMTKPLIFAIALLSLLAFGCSSGESGGSVANSTASTSSTPANIHQVPSTNGKVYIKDEGWEMPGVQLEEIEKGTYTDKTVAGQKVELTQKILDIKPPVITEEPFKSINRSLGRIQLRTKMEYSYRDRPFCLKFDANRVEVDENNTITSSHGSLFSFSYYDEDGDGKFESLVLDETDSNGIIGFSNRPHLPKWINQ